MAASLQEQLLNKGLINKNKAKQIAREKGRNNKLKNKNGVEILDENKLETQQKLKNKAEQDRLLNLERKAKAEEKAVIAQIKQLIQSNNIEVEDKDVAFIFTHLNKSQTLVVSRLQEQQLNKGRLSIVYDNQAYSLVASQVADKIHTRNPDYLAFQADMQQLADDEQDYYADYEIPDDLMW